MSLSSLELINFQSHQNTVINLSEGFNCIVGKTDHGKSAILKALYWLFYNKPTGDDYISWWCKGKDECKVTAHTGEGNIISRVRSKLDNYYILNGVELRGFNQAVPEEVQKILNVTDINFQLQKDPYFLFNQSSPVVSQYMNKLINLDSIDIAHSNAEKKKRKAKAEVVRLEKEIENIEKKLLEFTGLDDFEKRLEQLELEELELKNIGNKYNRLIQIEEELEEIDKSKEKFVRVKAKDKVNKLLEDCKELKLLEDKITRLKYYKKELYINELELDRIKDRIKKADKKRIERLLEDIESNTILLSKIERLEYFKNELQMCNESILIKKQGLENKKKEFDKLFPDICPLCGKKK